MLCNLHISFISEAGTKFLIGSLCGLDKGNIHFLGIISMYGESKITWFDFLLNLKVQSAYCKNNRPFVFFKIFEVKKWLDKNLNPYKECEEHGDMIFLSEIITNFIF
jgi:hypothetical protein